MQSKNKKAPTVAERRHIQRIKAMPCAVCEKQSSEYEPSDCHEIKQGQWFSSVPLCKDCHTGKHNGLHGEKAMWKVMKMDEIDALAVTVERLVA
jgi:hypothetical protein